MTPLYEVFAELFSKSDIPRSISLSLKMREPRARPAHRDFCSVLFGSLGIACDIILKDVSYIDIVEVEVCVGAGLALV